MEFELLRHVPEDDRRSLLAAMRHRRFKPGQTIFHEGDIGDALHLVARGRVAIRVSTADGDVATLVVLRPGECFGEGALVGSTSRRSASAVAVDTTETLALHRDGLAELRRAQPSVDQFLIEVLAEQVRRLSTRLLETLYVTAEIRVLRRVLELARAFDEDDGPIIVPMTQEDLASMAGTTRPTANRVLQAAVQEGYLRLHRGRFEVLDLAALIEAAG